MYFPDRGCVRTLRHLYGYATGVSSQLGYILVQLRNVNVHLQGGSKTGPFCKVCNFYISLRMKTFTISKLKINVDYGHQ